MATLLRSDKAWMQALLWLVTAAFAAFLIGLGGKLLKRMADGEPPLTVNQFIEPVPGSRAQAALRQADAQAAAIRLRLEQARHQLGVASTNTALARQNFDLWLAARAADARPDQDAELLARSEQFNQVRAAGQRALAALHEQEQALVQAQRLRDAASARWRMLEQAAMRQLEQARWHQQLRSFLCRLAVIAPVLALAGWLFVRKRGSLYWPFIWGFIMFAAFMLFVELIPHVPSYGGYVRYLVGIVVTVLVGRLAIVSMQEKGGSEPVTAGAGAAMFDGQCPACAAALPLGPDLTCCDKCGMQLFTSCPQCKTRKVAFARFCFTCGQPDSRPALSPSGRPVPCHRWRPGGS